MTTGKMRAAFAALACGPFLTFGSSPCFAQATGPTLEPQLVAGTLISDNVARFDFTLGVVARH